MNIKNANRRLLDSENEVSYSQRVAIVNLLENQQQEIERLKKNQWISVDCKESLALGEEVFISIIYNKQRTVQRSSLYYTNASGLSWTKVNKERIIGEVTHFMYIPKAPEATS